ncbi:MAG: zf-HC2 domain-containing protein, partial [Pyrinomonadaceae bacterium]|nr:zf-HC2 domain-containing protein [Pyrinomonadaceae bacterium]
MSCEKYQKLISESIDGAIDLSSSRDLGAHLSICAECSKINEDFHAITNFYEEGFAEDSIPPNSQALWCRINNIIETEVKAELLEEETKA